MHQQDSSEEDLGARLTAYYGPPLREQPLPSDTWHKVRRNLGPQKMPGRKVWHGLRRPGRSRTAIPAYVQTAFAQVTYQAREGNDVSLLRCALKNVREPVVRVAPLWRPLIQLTLPMEAAISMEQAELEVLLATGLARYLLTRRLFYRFALVVFASFVLLGSILLLSYWMHSLLFVGILIAVLLTIGSVAWLGKQKRAMAFEADSLTVSWLGRGSVCEGLHALADRNRSPYRRRWSEPSLAERIVRVCGTRVEVRDDSLTLVR